MISEVSVYAKDSQRASGNAARKFRYPICRNHENVELMMWAKAQDT